MVCGPALDQSCDALPTHHSCVDAVPKKRGPKTDVLEALLKRVDGLEAKLKEKNAEDGTEPTAESSEAQTIESEDAGSAEASEPPPKRLASVSEKSLSRSAEAAFASVPPAPVYDCTPLNAQAETNRRCSEQPITATIPTETLINAYFTTGHGKPYFILDESAVRQRLQLGQCPQYLVDAMCSTVAKLVKHISPC